MRYWGYFTAKLAGAAATLYGLLLLIDSIWPAEKNPPLIAPLRDGPELLGYNLLMMGWFLMCVGAVVLIVHDQRRRCRICLRRLRMPIETGSWGRMLFLGRPRIEYICPYGHGTLKEEELQISGREAPVWTPNSDDLWDDLCASSKESDKES
ncbi:MAG: hypothetical protein LAQ30_15635 [Acidobacteriia bacterium]|nr:hypothetical protein [Terriglobia bacterium]